MKPPIHLRWTFRLFLNRFDRRALFAELQELYAHRLRRDGEIAARAWLRRQYAAWPWRLALYSVLKWTPTSRTTAPGLPPKKAKEPMQNLSRDIRHSLRSLARRPALAATIILTVGLGLGATTAIFSVIHAVLLQPLPYTEAEQLVRIYTDSPPNEWPLSVADYLALREQQTSFSAVAGFRNRSLTLHRGDMAERVRGQEVTWTYFPLLGISPLHGRLFNEADDLPGAPNTVVLGHAFWSRHLGQDPAAVGKTIRLSDAEHTVIGVLPAVAGPLQRDKDLFTTARWETPRRKGPFFIFALGRLRPGVDRAAAGAELRAINRRLFPVWAASYQDERASWGLKDLKEVVVGDAHTRLLLVLTAVGFVLLIACTNAANLLVARATQRGREMAVRSALGASRGQLLRRLLSESALLAAGAALVGWALAAAGIRLLSTLGADTIPRAAEIAWSAPVAWFLAAVTVASGLLFGLIPSMHGSQSRLEEALRSGGRSAGALAAPRRLRRALVVCQFAVAAPLLIASGLLISSLARLQRVDVGFEADNLLTALVSPSSATYSEPTDVVAFQRELLSRLEALPGVRRAAFADGRPSQEIEMINNFDLLDKPTPAGQSQPNSPWVAVTPGYFHTLGIPLIEGRLFDDSDIGPDAPPVVMVDREWARRFFPGQSAVGRRFRDGGCTSCEPNTVIGVVADVKHLGLDQGGDGTVYWLLPARAAWTRFLIVRTAVDPLSLLPALRETVRRLDPALPLSRVAPMTEVIDRSLESRRTLVLLLGMFASVALILSLVGIYGVMSYFVQQHARDIAIRMALGGGPGQVLGGVVKQGMLLVGIGLGVGLAGAAALTRLLSGLLFGIGPTDPLTFSGVTALMLGASLAACLFPARRAAALDPARVLRDE